MTVVRGKSKFFFDQAVVTFSLRIFGIFLDFYVWLLRDFNSAEVNLEISVR
jgi:hypothetical protein